MLYVSIEIVTVQSIFVTWISMYNDRNINQTMFLKRVLCSSDV